MGGGLLATATATATATGCGLEEKGRRPEIGRESSGGVRFSQVLGDGNGDDGWKRKGGGRWEGEQRRKKKN